LNKIQGASLSFFGIKKIARSDKNNTQYTMARSELFFNILKKMNILMSVKTL
jgi:hypothetical protein